ncbi:putative quinol monooxygenase [Streptomyces platensis]|uniref:putative quinol monooxygenase n=1 Tax=Streptomyces platensis TaxID=58346 RepID=UPI0036871E41
MTEDLERVKREALEQSRELIAMVDAEQEKDRAAGASGSTPVPAPDLGPNPTGVQILRAAAEVCRAEATAQDEPKMIDQANWFDQVADQAEAIEADGHAYAGIGLSTAREILGLDPDSSQPTAEELTGAQYALNVRFILRDAAAAAAFDALVDQLMHGIRAEPGTWIYNTWTPEGEPLVRMFYEVYADRVAFEEHEAQPHTQHFLAEREQHLERFEVTYLNTDRAPKPEGAAE